MRKRLAALAVASILVVPAVAEAATASDPSIGASASQASTKTLKSALRKDVKRALKGVRKLDLATVASKGFSLKRIRALTAGKLSLTATVRSDSGRVTVTKGSRTFGTSGKKNVRVKPTRSGKQLLGATNRVTLRLKATFAPRTGRRVSVVYRVTLRRSPGSSIGPEGGTLPPPTPVAPIPADATPLYSQNFENSNPASWGPGLTRQCGGTVGWGNDGGDGYAHLVLPADATPVAGLERCELSHGEYGDAREPGSYWYHARIKLGEGFPHQPAPGTWTTIQQWQEDEPTAPTGGPDPVDGAMFVNSGPAGATSARTYLQGQYLVPPISQGPLFEKSRWIDFVVHGVWTDQPDGYLEWWIDGTYVGRTNGVTSAVGGRHFWKGGITRADAIDTLQTADIADLNVYRK
jgi:Polysaccharide lyase